MPAAHGNEGAWREQISRIRRWHTKVKRINQTQTTISEGDLDLLYAFFMNCFHLKDWLKQSTALPPNVIDGFFDNNEKMKICHSICTGAKHLRITSKRIPNFGMAREYVPAPVSGGVASSRRTRLVNFQHQIYDMVTLADECMSLVEDFLHKNGLM